jgi:hypothetical protein
VWWVWLGGIVLGVGALIVMWPQAERRAARRESGYVAQLEPAVAGAPSEPVGAR